MVVMRANALIRNITRKLAADIERHESAARKGTGGGLKVESSRPIA
jgi:hypothetical protein